MKHIFKALLIGAIALLSINAYSQSNSKKSDWQEVQTVVLPSDVTIHEGVTRTGNPKYWIEIEDIKVPVSPGTANKFKMHQVQVELVKWENNGKFKYSTRQVKGSSTSKSKNIDLMGLFK